MLARSRTAVKGAAPLLAPVRALATPAHSPPSPPPTSAPSSSQAQPPASLGSRAPTPVWEHHVPLEPSHGCHVATLHLRAYDDNLADLGFFTNFALRAARALGLPTTGAAALPTATWLRTVPRSPFVHKKSQQNFWRRTHKRAIKVYDGDEEVVQAWLAYLRKEAFPGVGMKAQYWTYRPLGWGKDLVSDRQLDELALRAASGSSSAAATTEAQTLALAGELVGEIESEAAHAQSAGTPAPSGGIESEPVSPPQKQELEEAPPRQAPAAAAGGDAPPAAAGADVDPAKESP